MEQELIRHTQTLLSDPGIPDWAKFLGALISTIVIAGSFLLGRKKAAGQSSVVADGKSVVLEGALVDSSSIKVLSGSVEALGYTIKAAELTLQANLTALTLAAENTRRLLDANEELTEALGEIKKQFETQRQSRDELTHEMRELRVQVGIFAATMRNPPR